MKRILLPTLVIGVLLLSACGAPTTAPPTEAPPTPPSTEQPTPSTEAPPIEQQTYTLSISVSPSGAGSVSPLSGRFEEDTQVTLTATPASGYTFDYWDGDASDSSATVTIIMDSDKSVIAHFADTTPPVISGVDVSNITETSASIIWTTGEPATSQIEYGKTTSYGSTTPWDEGLVTSHSISLTGLEPNTTYHFRVRSKDKAGNEALSGDYTFATLKPATKVGGIISSDTTWTKADSPYVINSTVQVPSGVTLTIEPGVTVSKPTSGDMFLLMGTIRAHGTSQELITFDGKGNSSFFSAPNRDPYIENAFADLDYCIIRNGGSFWPADGRGYFWLRHSELSNLSSESWLWYEGTPKIKDFYIEYNKFTNCGGFRINNSGASFYPGINATVYIRYNLFDGKTTNASNYYIFNEVSSGDSAVVTVVNYNSFINMSGIVLKQGNYTSPNISATQNYWGTSNTSAIDAMIYDKNDNIACAGYIAYLPILTSPHPSTPTP